MNGIYHKIGIQANANAVFEALTTQSGLSSWWTKQVEGDFSIGNNKADDVIQFRFGTVGGFEMKVQEVSSNRVLWKCISGPED